MFIRLIFSLLLYLLSGFASSFSSDGFLADSIPQWQEGDWAYEWQGNGMLRSVKRPDGEVVSFEYDPLGRRISKTFQGKITRWVWDGNVPLHEWTDTENVTTWLFDEGTFIPTAKIVGDKSYSIVTDYLGTPTEMFNSDGERIWSAELDIYGSMRTFTGRSLSECPFRYQGQYFDEETDLCYNRFRYYSPDEGMYISQDPIGLVGGTTLYSYVHDTNVWIDPFGLAPWEKGGFNSWFNNASVQDILDNKKIVEAALRAPGGKHEMFPVSIAHKARELGFTAEEIKSMSVDTGKITFVDVPDDLGNLLEGKHHASSASSFFHNRLIEDLNKAKTKPEAMDIIKKHHDAHMKVSNH